MEMKGVPTKREGAVVVDVALVPLAKEHNASHVKRAAACWSSSNDLVICRGTATGSCFEDSSVGAGTSSLDLNCESMVRYRNDDGDMKNVMIVRSASKDWKKLYV